MSDLHERLARLRAEQASLPPMTMEEVATALAARFAPHMEHPWERVKDQHEECQVSHMGATQAFCQCWCRGSGAIGQV